MVIPIIKLPLWSKCHPKNDLVIVYDNFEQRTVFAEHRERMCLNKLDKEEFLTYMKFSLQLERIFSLHQLNKVLEHMGLTYELLCDTSEQSVATCKHLYREKSNILAYYIISGIILNDYYGFLLWCYTNNTHLFQFNASNVTIASFIELIDKGYKTDELINVLQNLRKKNRGYFIENTTRMSAIEVIYK